MFSYAFIMRATIVGTIVSLLCALLGVCLVQKRFSMIGDGLSHVGFGALAVAAALGFAPLKVAVPVVTLAAVLLLRVSDNSKIKGDAAIALLSSGALAIGVTVVSLSSGINTDLYNYMFGSILAMSEGDVIFSCVLGAAALALAAQGEGLAGAAALALFTLFYNKIFAVTFDESFARSRGLHTGTYNLLIAVLTAVTVVLGMRMMGTLLISSLIIFPAVSAMRLCGRFRAVTVISAFISIICFLSGLVLSYVFSAPTGASVVIVNLAVFLVCSIIARVKSDD